MLSLSFSFLVHTVGTSEEAVGGWWAGAPGSAWVGKCTQEALVCGHLWRWPDNTYVKEEGFLLTQPEEIHVK